MEFCVLVKISKLKVSFWYQSGRSPFASLILKDSNEVPLYFYVNGNDFIFGDAVARDKFFSNDPNAYGNYFEIIKKPDDYFSIYGNTKPVKQLLYYGIEQYLSHFINSVLYKNDSIESYRQNFPLRFWFESDLEEKEKSLIENLFKEAGYFNIERVNYIESLFEVLRGSGLLSTSNSILLLTGINNALFLELFKNLLEPALGFTKLEGQGADPSVRILAEMILEDILSLESYLNVNKENEVANLLSYSAKLLEKIKPITRSNVILTNGKKYYFEVKQSILNERLLYYSNDGIMYAAIDDLLKSNNINIQNTILLLGSREINTPYIQKKLLGKYPNVKGIDVTNTTEALKLVFSKISQSGYLVKREDSTSSPVKNLSLPFISTDNIEEKSSIHPIIQKPSAPKPSAPKPPPPPPMRVGGNKISKPSAPKPPPPMPMRAGGNKISQPNGISGPKPPPPPPPPPRKDTKGK